MKVTLKNVRFSYANVFEPRSIEGATPKYSVSLLISKDDAETIQQLKTAIQATIEEGISKKFGGKKPATLDICLRDGDVQRPDDENYSGMYYINASNTKRPTVFNQYKKDATPDEFYSGCYGVAMIDLYAHSMPTKKGIYAQLVAVMKTKDGSPFGAGAADLSEFDAFAIKPDTSVDFL